MTGYLTAGGRWPGLAQVLRTERHRAVGGRTTVEVAYAITSLPPERAGAARLLALQRGHWGIENGLFRVRDVTLGEDACRVRHGGSPALLGALRGVVIHLAGRCRRSVAQATRRWNIHPGEAIDLLNQ